MRIAVNFLLILFCAGTFASLSAQSPVKEESAKKQTAAAPAQVAQDTLKKKNKTPKNKEAASQTPAAAPAVATPAQGRGNPQSVNPEEVEKQRKANELAAEKARQEDQIRRAEAEARKKEEDAARAREEAKRKAEEAERLKAAEAARKQEWDRKRSEEAALQAKLDSLQRMELEELRIARENRKASGEVFKPVIPEYQQIAALPEVPKTVVGENPKGLYSSTGPNALYMPYADPDKDGVVNQYDKCPDEAGIAENKGCPAGDPRGFPQSAIAPKSTAPDALDRIYFDAGSDYLNGNARMVLNKAIPLLKQNPAMRLVLAGHADGAERDSELARRRAEAARAYLISKGVPENRLQTDVYGKLLPASESKTEEGRSLNRRVELVIEAK
ncbi:MAG: hypothetical protein EAZ89_11435 [Bacteroidetes bacterium]|nr:MAG: hypothetical protein EAZ89_11435 [Bacteroidota bacterium]